MILLNCAAITGARQPWAVNCLGMCFTAQCFNVSMNSECLKSEGTRLALERVLLVRHGLTDWNVQGRWQGYEPVALNQDGWVQARMLARALKGRSFGEIISSDLPRAFETATAIGEVVGLSPRA